MRLFIEKKENFNTEAKAIKSEIQSHLKIKGVERVRVLYAYKIGGITGEQLQKAKFSVFAQKSSDLVTQQTPPKDANFAYTITPLQGQYNQKADSSTCLLKLMFPRQSPSVATYKHIAVYGQLTEAEFDKIKKYYINPLEYAEISLEDELNVVFDDKIEKAEIIAGFSNFDKQQLEQVKADYSISMSMQDFLFCQDYYRKENKDPSITELKILDTYWSDHCRHSTFLTVLDKIEFEENENNKSILKAAEKYGAAKELVYNAERPDSLMDMATMEMKKLQKLGILNNLEKSGEINACSIEVKGKVDGKEEDFVIMFKNETHNHPTEIEPFGGAATCIGGGIRDPLSGRAHVYGAMRITGAANPKESFDKTLKDKLSQRRITTVAADGYSSYGNQIGLASGHLQEYYDEGFKAKRMECGALVAYNYKKNITRANAEDGDVVILLGGKTGRDGIGGATGSSKQQKELALKHSAEVQKGNPLIERNIVRLFRKPNVSRLIKKCNDFGAGGVSVAIGELAGSLLIDLDKVPVKYPGLNGTEIAISESQERMAVLLAQKDAQEFIKQADMENLSAVKVADVTSTKRIVMNFGGQTICDISSEFLNSGGFRQHTQVYVKAFKPLETKNKVTDIKTQWIENLASLNVASKEAIADQFNKTAGAQTVFYPFGGTKMKTPEQGLAMRLPLLNGSTNLGTIMTVGYNPAICNKSPFYAALFAVSESILKIITMGGKLEDIRLSFQEYFESMKSKESWGKVYSALLGAFLIQDELSVPSIGGKDSMSGTYMDIDVPPSLLSFAVAPCDCSKLVSRAFKFAGNNVYILKTKITEDGTPDFESLKEHIASVTSLIAEEKIFAATVVGTGGIAACVSQMCFGNALGFSFEKGFEQDLFCDNYIDMIIETGETLSYNLLGKTTANNFIAIGETKIELDSALKSWEAPLSEVFSREYSEDLPASNMKAGKNIIVEKLQEEKMPKVLIPIFSGTNGEYSLEKQFKTAGAKVESLLFKTNKPKESFAALVAAIKTSNIIAIPSGMSAGAEPEAAAKMITIILSEAAVAAAINDFIARGGLILGIGEGFKALIETGLIENEAISKQTDSLSIERNKTNKFYSGLVKVKNISEVSPWADVEKKQIIPACAIDGCVNMSENDYIKYMNKGQVVSVYTDESGKTATNYVNNPFGAAYAVEAMVSPNGRVFGCISEPSELEKGLYSNVFKAEESGLFKAIVNFFK